MEIVRDSVFYSIPKAPKEGVRVKGACVLVLCFVWSGRWTRKMYRLTGGTVASSSCCPFLHTRTGLT